MRNWPTFLSAVIFATLSVMFLTGMIWEKSSRGLDDPSARTLLIHPQNPDIFFVGTEKALYETKNRAKEFRRIFTVPASDGGVNVLAIDSAGAIYVATDGGLFKGDPDKSNWRKIFSVDSGEKCLWVSAFAGKIYLGTTKGLFISNLDGKDWQRGKGALQNHPIYLIASDNEYRYFANDNQIFRANDDEDEIEQAFSIVTHEDSGLTEDSDIEIEENGFATKKSQIKFITSCNFASGAFLYIATAKGIFVSPDHGDSWQRLDSDGLPLEDATSLLVQNEKSLLLGTTKGVFRFDGQKWEKVYKGLESEAINYLASDSEGTVYTASDKGVFLLTEEEVKENLQNAVLILPQEFLKEPSIRQVQEMAIDYAEVHPKKIQSWRHAAKTKAWMPTVSLGVDRGSTDLRHWDTGPSPDVLLKGKDSVDWDVTVAWDLGDLIWSSDQTSIDSRSKLMVELREDILDQVTRLYFERRRLQMELAMNATLPAPDKIDREMRVEELTALIDGFTGGKFSEKTNK